MASGGGLVPQPGGSLRARGRARKPADPRPRASPGSGHYSGAVRADRIAIVGAAGPSGFHLAGELIARARAVRAIGRRREALERAFAGLPVEVAAADARDAASLERALEGCDLAVDCIGLPPERMHEHAVTARGLAAAAGAVGARILQVSSYWSFVPRRSELVDERQPREGGHAWFRARREAEDVLLATGAAIAHVPDFFGPRVHTSAVQRALEQLAAGGRADWMGGRGVEREVVYLPDAMATVADLLDRDEAYGADWALPGNGLLSADLLQRIASQHLGRPVSVRAAPAWLLALMSAVSPQLRAMRPLIAEYTRPVRYDASRLRALLGPVERRPLERAIAATLEWLRARPSPG